MVSLKTASAFTAFLTNIIIASKNFFSPPLQFYSASLKFNFSSIVYPIRVRTSSMSFLSNDFRSVFRCSYTIYRTTGPVMPLISSVCYITFTLFNAKWALLKLSLMILVQFYSSSIPVLYDMFTLLYRVRGGDKGTAPTLLQIIKT